MKVLSEILFCIVFFLVVTWLAYKLELPTEFVLIGILVLCTWFYKLGRGE